MAVIAQRYTFEDWLTLPDDGKRYELLSGELVEMPPPTANQALLVMSLALWLGQAQYADYGMVLTAPVAVILDAGMRRQNAPEPDVFFVRRDREHIIHATAVEGVPDLVIAILSPSNWRDDVADGTKWDLYQRYAVPHYWLVDPALRTVTQYRHNGSQFGAPVLLGEGDTLAFPYAPAITLPVTELFRNVRPF